MALRVGVVTTDAPSNCLWGDHKENTSGHGAAQFLDLHEHEVTALLQTETKAFFKKSHLPEKPPGNFKADFPSSSYDVNL